MTTYITTEFTGQSDIRPRRVKIKTTDSFATITTAGYLNNFQQLGYSFYPDDFFDISYGNNVSQTFTTSISAGIYTLEPSAGDVVLPVVSGNFTVFTGTGGALDDAGYSPSNAAKTKVVMANAATVANNLATFADITGTVKDAGARIISNTTAAYAGGGTSNVFVATGLTVAAKGTAVIRASTNSVSITKALPGTDTLTITFSADPGASTTVDYIYTTAAMS